jgi:hypothetical protein
VTGEELPFWCWRREKVCGIEIFLVNNIGDSEIKNIGQRKIAPFQIATIQIAPLQIATIQIAPRSNCAKIKLRPFKLRQNHIAPLQIGPKSNCDTANWATFYV